MAGENRELKLTLSAETSSAESALARVADGLNKLAVSAAKQGNQLGQIGKEAKAQTEALNKLATAQTAASAAQQKATAAAQQQMAAQKALAAQHAALLVQTQALANQFGSLGTVVGQGLNLWNLYSKGAGGAAIAVGGVVAAIVTAKAAFDGMSSVVQKTFDALDQGVKVDNITRSFKELQSTAGLIADDQLQRLRTAVQGTISDFDLMQASNLWQTLRLAPDQFDELAASAVRLGAAVGRNATQAISDLTIGLGRQSPRILDNLGIIVKAKEAYEQYAISIGKTAAFADKLTDSQKREAFQALAIERIQEAAAKAAPLIENAGRAYEQLKVALTNGTNAFAEAVANSDELKDSLRALTGILEETDWKAWGELFAEGATVALKAVEALLNALPGPESFIARIAGLTANQSEQSQLANLWTERERRQRTGASVASPVFSNLDDKALDDEINKRIINIRGKKSFEAFENESRGFRAEFVDTYNNLNKGLLGEFDFDEIDSQNAEKAQKAAEKAAKAAAQAYDKLSQDLAKSNQKALQERLEGQINAAVASGDTSGLAKLQEAYRKSVAEGIRAGYADELEKNPALAGKIEEVVANKVSAQFQAASNKIIQDFKETQQKLAAKDLEDQIAKAYKDGNLKAVPALIEQQAKAVEQGVLAGQQLAGASPEAVAAAEANAKMQGDAFRKIAGRELEEATNEAFRNSTELFADLFSAVVDGQAKNLEDVLKDVAKRFGIGLASQMASNIASTFGLGGVGQVGSVQGLGQAVAVSLGFGGGGVKGIGELLGQAPLIESAGALNVSAGLLSSAAAALHGAAGVGSTGSLLNGLLDGTTGNASGFSFGSLLEGAPGAPATPEIVGASSTIVGGSSWLTAAIPAIATAAAAAVAYSNRGALKGGDLNFAGQAALALPTAGLSFAYNPIKDKLFGGSSDPDRGVRQEIRGVLEELLGGSLTFNGVRGPIDLGSASYNIADFNANIGGPKGVGGGGTYGDAAGFIKPVVGTALDLFGDDKALDDFTGIFTNALSEAESFNEVIVNMATFLDDVGLSADELKDRATNAFLNGTISLEEFGSSLQALNILATENLTGPNSVSDALNIMSDNILANPQAALKGLELAFKEMAELGITSTEEVRAYIAENFGPDVQDVFSELSDKGFDTWEEIADATGDSLFSIFDTLNRYIDPLKEVFGEPQEIVLETSEAEGKLKNLNDGVKKLHQSIDNLPEIA